MSPEPDAKITDTGGSVFGIPELFRRTVAFPAAGPHVSPMSIAEIQQMPRREKLRLMEILWAELSREESELDSPDWHGSALRETAERLARGEEQVLDWARAKADLRQPQG